MAITIETAPDAMRPVYSDVIYTISSTNSGQSNFKFVAVVKNASGTTLAKLKTPVYAGTSYGVFNLSRILQNYVIYNFDLITTIPGRCLNSYLEYSIEFGEEYGTNPAEYLNLTSQSGKYVWNGLFSVWGSELLTDYAVDFAAERKFLTNVRTRRVTRAQYDYLYVLRGTATGLTKFVVNAYNAAGTPTTSVITNTFTGSGKNDYLLRLGAGVANLNQIAQGSLSSGTAGAVVPVGTVYYTIQGQNNSNTAGTEAYRFDVIDECSKFSPKYLYFLNPLGGFESVRCSMLTRERYEVSRKQMKVNTYGFTGTAYGRDTAKHGVSNYTTEKKKKVTLNTDFINEAEWEWLHDLISSPIVFYQGTIPVNITNTTYDVMTWFDGAQNLQIEIEYSEPEILQNI